MLSPHYQDKTKGEIWAHPSFPGQAGAPTTVFSVWVGVWKAQQ